MTKIIADEKLRNQLHNFSQALEICTEAGQVVGCFIPSLNPTEYEPWEPPFDEEELRRLEQSNEKRYTTAEVLARLEKL